MNKKLRIALSSLSAILVISGGAFFAYTKYQEKEKEQVLQTFIKSFEKKDFKGLTQTLSSKSLEKQKLDEIGIIKKYDTIFNGLEISKIKGKIKQLEKNKFKLSFSMNTPFGKIEKLDYQGQLVKNKKKYEIVWDYSLIFPKMTQGDKVYGISEPAKRGEIVDGNEQPLATNHIYPRYGMVPNQLGSGEDKNKKLTDIGTKFDVSVDDLNQLLSQEWVKEDSFVPIKIVDFNEPVEKYQMDGVASQDVEKRYYPLKEAAAQLIGYTGNVTAEEIEKKPELSNFKEIGKMGLEAQFDKELRGKNGGKINILNEKDELKEVLIEQKKEDGKTIQLTLDSQTQKAAFVALDNLSGATVVTDPTNGDLKAVVSSPSFDPNKFILGLSQKDYDAYAKDPQHPFSARFATGYAPGSTFKTITAAIGIDEKVTTPEKTHEISGLKWQKDSSWGNYRVTRVSDAVTSVNMETALIYSDNIYFSQEALEMGEAKYVAGLKKFPFGKNMDVHIPMTPAQISNGKIKSDILLADTSYGQGQLLINPIQQAVMYSVFPNKGHLVYPQILADSKIKKEDNVISPKAAEEVSKALIQTVENPNGTAHLLSKSDYRIAAKTGTAEIKEKQDIKGLENSFILAFDADEGRFLVLSMIENVQGTSAVEKNKDFIQSLK
ncbi:penicillin-binding protein PBP4(5) [Vagococcus sp.]|uniref:penicillin-binding protein PBP4(5) n=1 Tax=Vagococcus sp. TaxID=1933889 RepID=UPI003F9E0868